MGATEVQERVEGSCDEVNEEGDPNEMKSRTIEVREKAAVVQGPSEEWGRGFDDEEGGGRVEDGWHGSLAPLGRVVGLLYSRCCLLVGDICQPKHNPRPN